MQSHFLLEVDNEVIAVIKRDKRERKTLEPLANAVSAALEHWFIEDKFPIGAISISPSKAKFATYKGEANDLTFYLKPIQEF